MATPYCSWLLLYSHNPHLTVHKQLEIQIVECWHHSPKKHLPITRHMGLTPALGSVMAPRKARERALRVIGRPLVSKRGVGG